MAGKVIKRHDIMTDDWTPEELEALQRLPHDERLRMRLDAEMPRRRGTMTGMRLREIRLTLGLTQKEMGDLISVTPDHVSRLERDLVPIGPLMANAVEYALWVAKYESCVD